LRFATASFRENFPKYLDRIIVQGLNDAQELQDVDPSLSTLIVRNERLWLAETLCKLLLCQAGPLPRIGEDGTHFSIFSLLNPHQPGSAHWRGRINKFKN
jgi:hypothetical protein